MSEPLKPCPFCSGKAEIEAWHGGAPTKVLISCEAVETGCLVRPSVTGETPEEAVAAWNRRSPSISKEGE